MNLMFEERNFAQCSVWHKIKGQRQGEEREGHEKCSKIKETQRHVNIIIIMDNFSHNYKNIERYRKQQNLLRNKLCS
jgi:hypothetical protein